MSSSASQSTEDERAYLQSRVQLLSKSLLGVAVIMLSLDVNCYMSGRTHTVVLSMLYLAAFSLLLVFSKVRDWSALWLHRASFAALFTGLTLTAIANRISTPAMISEMMDMDVSAMSDPMLTLVLYFGTNNVLILGILTTALRAAVVPSTRLRTSIESILLGVPVVVLATWGFPFEPETSFTQRLTVEHWFVTGLGYTLYWVLTVFACGLISHIVYGLRKQVVEARRLGPYTLERKIGEGGMGVVYQARHALLRRATAIKLLTPERTGAKNLERFESEVRLTARLTHPNTVTIFDYGRTPDGLFYYAMELLEGANLEQVLRAGGPMPPGRALKVLTEICGALEEAHSVGLIHRDIKPSNALLCTRGGKPDVTKLVDFGLVKELGIQTETTEARSGDIVGTPLYMAPEAMKSPDSVDERSDIYSLGAVGYFLLTGEHVFEGRTTIEIMGHQMHSLPPAMHTRRGSSVPQDLEELILACLKKDPSQRPQSARELRLRIEQCESFGQWSDSDASQWWSEHGQVVKEHNSFSPNESGDETIAVSRDWELGVA